MSLQDAEQCILRIDRRTDRDIRPVRSYLCPDCNTYHLTSERIRVEDTKPLKDQVEKLKKRIARLEEELKEAKKETMIEVKKDETVKVQTEQIKILQKKISVRDKSLIRMREESGELLYKIMTYERNNPNNRLMERVYIHTNIDAYLSAKWPKLPAIPRKGELIYVVDSMKKYFIERGLPPRLEVCRVSYHETHVEVELWYNETDYQRVLLNNKQEAI